MIAAVPGTAPLVLVADDDPAVGAAVALLLERHGYRTRAAATVAEALAAAGATTSGERVDLVLSDMNFSRVTSGEEGLALLAQLREQRPQLPVVLMTAWGSIPLAVQGMKAGAADFITKPWSNAQLVQSVATALALAAPSAQPAAAAPSRAELAARGDFSGLIGQDPKLLRILELVARVAPTDASVLITGESGTGKELVAEAIHRNSKRRAGPFVKVNLGGISSTLFESEIFGHVRGAFTGAAESRRGRFEAAHGGTIFLDEIGEVEPAAQVKLLRVLQDRTFEQLGSSSSKTVDVRVVAATNRNLAEMVAAGEFREDLLYRLNLITVHVPPLRERAGDVAELAEGFLAAAARAYGRAAPRTTAAARTWLMRQPWPGNVRQLRQTMERALLVLDAPELDEPDLAALAGIEGGAERTAGSAADMTIEQMERQMIVRCLERCDGNVTRAAETLGLSRGALYRRLEKYGLS